MGQEERAAPSASTRGQAVLYGARGNVIHVLYHGLPLCLFCDKETPAEWPPGHKWVSVDDPNLDENVDCRECKEQNEKIKFLRTGKGDVK
jgi:hypothetical protein